jgi:hypothetical protein
VKERDYEEAVVNFYEGFYAFGYSLTRTEDDASELTQVAAAFRNHKRCPVGLDEALLIYEHTNGTSKNKLPVRRYEILSVKLTKYKNNYLICLRSTVITALDSTGREYHEESKSDQYKILSTRTNHIVSDLPPGIERML